MAEIPEKFRKMTESLGKIPNFQKMKNIPEKFRENSGQGIKMAKNTIKNSKYPKKFRKMGNIPAKFRKMDHNPEKSSENLKSS